MGTWVAWLIGVAPLLWWLLWWWNDLRYGLTAKFRSSGGGTKLPPGHMGIPLFGEMLSFLWYFKFLRRPDDYITSKRRKYGDGVGMYRTHLFGSPSIIAYSPSINKLVTQSDSIFVKEGATLDIVGRNSLTTAQGKTYTRIKSFVSRTINQPDPLRRIALMVQPGIIAALQSWALKGRVIAIKEVKKITFENIGKYFANIRPGPVLNTLDDLFSGILKGLRTYPIKFPGSAYHKAIQCRKKAVEIFREELERRRREEGGGGESGRMRDLMDGLMSMKDEEGKQLEDIEVLETLVGLLVASYDSTSLALTWALYYLANHPIVLQKLREEHMALGKSKCGELITSDEIWKLKYTNKVVEETMRLANIAAFAVRTATQDVDYKSYKIPKGWQVICWFRYLHVDPENFEDPLCFNPDRWNKQAKPGTYLVFGGGPRSCPGNMLARLQIAIFLHYLAVGYKWELVNPNAEISYLPHPKPVDGVEISISKL